MPREGILGKLIPGYGKYLLRNEHLKGYMSNSLLRILYKGEKMNPTNEQLKSFWEACGFKQVSRFGGSLSQATEYLWLYPEDKHYKDLPPIDLNNLFKWAVPKLQYQVNLKNIRDGWFCMLFNSDREPPRIEAIDEDPALALFWVCYKVLVGD